MALRLALLAALLLACEPPPEVAAPTAGPTGRAPGPAPGLADGHLDLVILDEDSGAPMPGRVLVTALPPTPALRLDRDVDGVPQGGEIAVQIAAGILGAPGGLLVVDGVGSLAMPPGRYSLFFTRGPEWEAVTREIEIVAGARRKATALLRRSVDTRGWLAADLHIHTGRSPDSRLPLEDRVVSEVAVGVEILVATDHNALTDLQPAIEELGHQALARAFVGDEFDFLEGHGGAYPLPYASGDLDGGARRLGLDWVTARTIHDRSMFDRLRALPTRPAVTINHPRLPPDLGYFTNLKAFGARGWAPPQPLPEAGRFDALEVMNGYMHAPEDLGLLLRDWFFLLSSGHRVTALGNSDSHRLRDVEAGFPRTWLRLPSDEPWRLLPDDLGAALRHQRAIASNGPFVTLTVAGAGIGETVRLDGETALCTVEVDVADWVDVDHLRLYVNAQVAWESELPRGRRPRFRGQVPVRLPPGDAWIVAQADGTTPLPTALIGQHQGGRVRPFAITNPVFIDHDGDGRWSGARRNRDPGPLAIRRDRRPLPDDVTARGHPSGDGCEPPLHADPARWAEP